MLVVVMPRLMITMMVVFGSSDFGYARLAFVAASRLVDLVGTAASLTMIAAVLATMAVSP